MEPPEAKVRYVIHTKVVKTEERKQRIHVSGVGPNVKFREESLGWFVTLVGSYEALYLGEAKPAFAHGDTVRITFEKVPDANPR